MIPSFVFRPAQPADMETVWQVLQQAIERRRLDGSQQWQDGYPNPQVVAKDISAGYGRVLLAENGSLAAYCAVMVNNEPAYDKIDGEWLTAGTDFLVLHRIAVADNQLGKGIAVQVFREAERLAREQDIRSIRIDTNFDNLPMLHLLNKMGYIYCGEVVLRADRRKAFEKRLYYSK